LETGVRNICLGSVIFLYLESHLAIGVRQVESLLTNPCGVVCLDLEVDACSSCLCPECHLCDLNGVRQVEYLLAYSCGVFCLGLAICALCPESYICVLIGGRQWCIVHPLVNSSMGLPDPLEEWVTMTSIVALPS
jgi:hypothetical protein